MKLRRNAACWLWNSVCYTIHGVDSNGDEVSDLTSIAGAALAADVPTHCQTLKDQESVAQFLRTWADALEGKQDD